ncbi:MAG: hypothetical protein ACOYOV_00360 [Bacteroidales bacterium]
MSKNEKYFAAKEGSEAAAILMDKITSWSSALRANGFFQKLRDTWNSYHGAFFANAVNSHQITFGGEQGELTNLAVNHIRNLGQHMLVMTTSSRPSLEARAANTDYKSLVQTQLANGLLDYYMREKRMERYIKNAVETAIVLGAGYIKMEWDATEGKVIETDEETGLMIHEGDVKFSNLSPFDIVFDQSKEDSDHDWIISRVFRNRYDLAAKYPEFEDKILGLPTKDMADGYYLKVFSHSDSDEVAVYTFHHKKTDAMPDGRELVFLSDDIVLLDQPLPYRRIPIFRISPNDYLGTPFGYSSLFDLMPLQEAINSLYSSVLSNHTAFGVQNIFVKTGSNVNMTNLTGALNIIEGLEPPTALNLQSTSPQTMEFLGTLERTIETLSGINSVTRGNPEANLKSGTALALVQSMAIQFISGLQQQYVALMEDMGTGLIEVLKDYAQSPRVASIVGKNNKTYIKEFKSDDLQEINRVVVDVGNPLARTTAGRIQMAEQMLQMKAESFTIDQYLQVINTGKIEVMTDPLVREENLIELENEMMMAGTTVPVLAIDDHMVHIKQHKSVLADPNLRKDQAISKVVLDHIMDHINIARQMDPGLMQALNQQPIPPAAPQAPTPGEVAQAPGPQEGAPQAGMPNMPVPSAPLQGLPMTPEAGMASAGVQIPPPQGPKQ